MAFVYDRCATRRHHHLDMRLAGCHRYAVRMDWVLAGRWTDLGSHALSTTRPQLAALLEAMRAESGRREVLCLVHNWGRLASDPVQRLATETSILRMMHVSECPFLSAR
ncbi:recombinase family protein [Streptomyces sp. NPDC101150]|uniref:recombinase family protein n=1 Tax=Streptomyces sp. NPDC101150 TaxID=3366114 RepID=UPI0038217352